MPYTQPTLVQARDAVASRLNDPTFVQWVEDEIDRYIREALRTWNAWTQLFRDRGTFSLAMTEPFYDLPTELPLLLGHTVTNWDLVADLQYALLEPAAAGGTWTGTDQFTLEQLSTAIQRRRDMFLRDSGAVLTRTQPTFVGPVLSGRLDLDEAVMIVRRAAWRPDATQLLQPLVRDDSWSADAYLPSMPAANNLQFAYSVSDTPPLTMRLIPPILGDGTLDLISINKGADVDPLVEAPLGVPDDWAWVIKYGALMDLLQGDGLALDPGRAAYCQARWDQGVAAAQASAVVLNAQINGQSTQVNALTDADRYSPTWQLVPAVPHTLLTAGQNLLASWPPPGAGAYVVTLDVVRNAPVPTVDGDILQISADVYDAILDYAQHLAVFKLGPGQLDLASALLQRAASAAGVELKVQQASQPTRRPLLAQTTQEEAVNARVLPAVPVE